MKRFFNLHFFTAFRRFLFPLHNPKTQMENFSERYRYDPILRWNPQVEEYFVAAYGADHFSRISKALTKPSCYSCIRVNTLKSTAEAVIEKLSKMVERVGPEIPMENFDSSRIDTDLNFDDGAEENSILKVSEKIADEDSLVFNKFQGYSISRCSYSGLDHVVFVRGSGPHTIDYGYANSKPPKEVIVSRKCAEAVLRGAQVYVPGVMACSGHVDKGDIVAVSVATEQPNIDGGWSLGITRGTVLQGLQTDPYHSERNGLYIGQGTTMMSRAGIFRASEGIAVDMNRRVFQLPSFYEVLEGEIFLQNLPSIVTARVLDFDTLDPQKGERILDMCAAPGGKTTAIAILMKDEGEIVAVDRSHNKVMNIKKLAAEMGLSCITTYKLDALKAVRQTNVYKDTACQYSTTDDAVTHTSSILLNLQDEEIHPITSERVKAKKTSEEENANKVSCSPNTDRKKYVRRARNGPGKNQCTGGRAENSKGFPPNSFDRVLLDAPCSALGLRPRLFAGEETIDSLRKHGKYQRRMFDQAVQLVRPGGVIVYSTCTINPGENEALVRYALDTYTFLSLATQDPQIGGPGLVGHYKFSDGSVEEWLRPGEVVQRFDPSSPLDTIGFFIAKFNVGLKDI